MFPWGDESCKWGFEVGPEHREESFQSASSSVFVSVGETSEERVSLWFFGISLILYESNQTVIALKVWI